ncbi:RNAse adapter protein rapZ [Fadolivirus algeromassiliense]|uniref:RNAse adapter protein rapZ n=1 Tax=Fadolivirus FV1/VV64 TaxID=3070911 RepID=A0A7D3V540_9VIRU|nr:RNAse adapter protein rapZ [Fadolivirus algeromassiliense]QKF93475.1 RNAse adapter protein rapZ [Fadolivirus FV1/VV64]
MDNNYILNIERELTILTWGKSSRKFKPNESQKNFSVGMISILDYGLNLKKINGKNHELQNLIMSDKSFIQTIKSIVLEIEKNNYNTISICCDQGRHRSVAVAEIIKKIYYPQTNIKHLDL